MKNTQPFISDHKTLNLSLNTSKDTALFLLQELFDSIESRLSPSSKKNIESLLGFLLEKRSSYSLPSLQESSSIADAIETSKFLKFYLEFNHLAERFHRIRETREAHLIPSLLSDFKKNLANISADEFKSYFENVQIDLVFTAHPTEIYERKILKKYIAMMENLRLSLDSKASIYQKDLQKERKSILLSLWLSPSHRSERPSPKDEAKLAQMIYQYSLWRGLSQFKRLFHSFLREQKLPLDINKNSFRFYSWMGGDRDGNPYVTAKATQSIVKSFIKKSCHLYFRSFKRLKEDLSFEIKIGSEVYRPEAVIEECKSKVVEVLESDFNSKLLLESEALLCHKTQELYDKLVQYDAKFLADQRLLDMIDRLNTFGLVGMRWDIRQESAYHDQIFDEVFKNQLPKAFSQMSEDQRCEFLISNRLHFSKWIKSLNLNQLSAEAKDFLETFNLVSKYGSKIFKYYIISMTRSASDLLLTHTLLKAFGSQTQTVPLFETLEDLENSADIMDAYFQILKQEEQKESQQSVMLGYSDSAKTGSRLSSVWSLYLSQKKLMEVSKRHNVSCRFFHGRGGSVGRGGGPVPQAINSCPIEAIQDGFRVTVQGEVIFDRFGFPQVATQSLMTYIVSLLNYRFSQRKSEDLLQKLETKFEFISEASKTKYRKLLNHPLFYDYFEAVTPVNHMSDLNIGSRPSKRSNSKQKSYRAIPWIFGWTQNRSLLPAWYGAGTALKKAAENYGLDDLKNMYKSFYLFQSALDSLYTTSLKTDFSVFKHYHQSLASKEQQEIYEDIEAEYQLLVEILPQIIDKKAALHIDLEEKLQGRLEVLGWLNQYQAKVLSLQQSGQELSEDLHELLVLSIQGLASGMGNTG